ncbi:signal peptidase II [Aerococcus sp. 1KP-2016]|jgi:signal peptidase II|uniref:signal peptidase II n=1 Tax=Aerococcus sp. 1KP-2016 TaxID=1981982 RepID=UPI000B998A86|nr:signal peptidase II [Aerococcus sp. 1KP-2016]OYQ68199.1 signal peptidase II [Aerococcus sp. 1KP-2016]
MFLYYILIAIIVGIDQFVKNWTVANLNLLEAKEVIPGLLSLFYLQNDGAAWGIFSGQMWLFYLITLVVVGVLFYMLHKEGKDSRLLSIGLSFMIGGALGNFIDRLHLSYVVDMFKLDFINFPIFNVADVALTIGVIIMLIYMLVTPEEKMKTDNK